MPATVDNMLRWWGREGPELPALSLSGDMLTYAELNAWVGRVAADFADRGLQSGDRVTVYAANSLEWIVAAFAAQRAGAILAALNSKMTAAEVAYLLGDYSPAITVVDEEGAERLAAIGDLVSRTGEPVAAPLRVDIAEITALRTGADRDLRREIDPEAPHVIVTTSGSTARPKGVMFSHRTMLDYIACYVLDDPIDVPHPKLLVVAPLSTNAGIIQVTQSIVQGGCSYLEPRFDADQALRLIVKEKITIFASSPIFFQRIADCAGFAEADVSSIQIAHTGGATVEVRLLEAWAAKGVLVRQIYGQTEAGGNSTINPCRYAISHPDKCGHGGGMKDVAIIDADGNFLPAGQQGQIVLRGAGVMLGYWNNPQATAETLVNGWLRTGDIGVIDELGLLKFIDRMKDIIISGGMNISAAAVERVFLEHPGVEEVAVIAAPDEKFGETPMAIIYGAADLSLMALAERCHVELSGYMIPKYMVIVDEPLPRLATGKISKPLLRQKHLSGPLPEPAPRASFRKKTQEVAAGK